MSSASEFWDMGGYGFFVWSAYAVWAAVMLWNVLSPWLRHRAVTRRLERRARSGHPLAVNDPAQEEAAR